MGHLLTRFAPLLFGIAAWFSCFTAVEASVLVHIFGGAEFAAALVPVQIMALYPAHQAYGQLASSVFHATGKTKVEKMTMVADIGKVVNRLLTDGQLYGGIAQGIGLALTEDYEDIKKHSTMAGAGIPTIKDIPDDLELIYVETPRPDGPFGASGTGEIPLCGPHPAIINAIYNACGARVTHLPAYPEKVLAAMPKK